MITQAPFPRNNAAKVKALWMWANAPRSASIDDFGPSNFNEFHIELLHRADLEFTWEIQEHGQTIGYVGAVQMNPMAAQIKGLVVDPNFRGKGYGPQALKNVVQELKDQRGYTKVLASCFSTNRVMITRFEKMKATREGTFHKVTRVGGELVDLILWDL